MAEPDLDRHLDRHAATKRYVARWCDNLDMADVDRATASDPTKRYNCFGFVLGDRRWWQAPLYLDGVRANPTHVWPADVSDDGSVDSYVRAAESEGFAVASDGGWSDGSETIVLYYTDRDRQFTHAARQCSSGVWANKLGGLSHIEHPVDGVDCIQYGRGRVFMTRPRSDPAR